MPLALFMDHLEAGFIYPRDDLLAEASKRQQRRWSFFGVIYAHQLHVPIGICIRDLEIIAMAGESEDLSNSVLFLPL